MILINSQFLKVAQDEVKIKMDARLSIFKRLNPRVKLIELDSGDVTRPLANCVVSAMQKSVLEMAVESTFKGRSPSEGYPFLIDAILKYNQKEMRLNITRDEIFVNDGTKEALASIGDILCKDNRIAVVDPVYQTFVEANVISNRAGTLDENERWSHLVYLNCQSDNDFMPDFPEDRPDVIFLCYPNDPTGCVLTKKVLEKWVKYALKNNSVILFDATFTSFIKDSNVPKSIYEIKGAKKCCLEFRSFSKSAGFTGLNCGYTIIPKEIEGYSFFADKSETLNKLWRRRQEIMNNAPSYIVQRGAEALFTKPGLQSIEENVDYYLENARILKEALTEAGFKFWGGDNVPYIWVESPYGSSWKLFDRFLRECHIVCSPGERFGANGHGYVRLSGFANQSKVIMASVRIAEFEI